MSGTRVSSVQNPWVKLARKLADRRGRDKEGLILVEGVRLIEEAETSRLAFEALLYSDKGLATPRGRDLVERRTLAGSRVLYVDDRLLDELATTETPQGVLAIVRPALANWGSLSDTHSERSLVVAALGLQDPGNVGTLWRAADAFGATAVVVSKGTADPYSPKVLRATMGAAFRRPPIQGGDALMTCERLREAGLALVAAVPNGGRPLPQVDLTGPVAILVGNEGAGLDDRVVAMADLRATIPMPGSAESLNAAVAAAIILYEAVRQRSQG